MFAGVRARATIESHQMFVSWQRRRRVGQWHVRGMELYTISSSSSSSSDVIASMAMSQNFVILVAACAYYVQYHRPRGWSRRDLLEVKQSMLGEGAGMGVFARLMIPAETTLGAYPGVVRNDVAMTAKSIVAPMSRYYCFSTRPGCILDPTGNDGYPSARPTPCNVFWPFQVDTTLSYVNEPSLEFRTNVRVEDDPDDPMVGLIFVSDRDIDAGEELFIDYGVSYDRSDYKN